MAFIEWSDSFSVRVPEIDAQHQQLVGMINELHEAMRTGRAQESVGNLITRLIYYTETHFATEERYLRESDFPQFVAHAAEHKSFAGKVKGYQCDLASGRPMLSMDMMKFLGDWLVQHIQGVDRQYVDHLARRKAG